MEEQKTNSEVDEETRKIQLTGKSTYIVSLPKNGWRAINYEKGIR